MYTTRKAQHIKLEGHSNSVHDLCDTGTVNLTSVLSSQQGVGSIL